MLTELDAEQTPSAKPSLVTDDIAVRRTAGHEAMIVAAAKAWARAFEAMRRQAAPTGEGAELALYDALADVSVLKSAELSLYRAVLTSELIPK